ncbi:MAG: hypothetical protein COB08_003855 [Rhodobacteraceae bacterium]|nr:hypothetical protein [Paracoccaceae bacterium]
MMKRYLVELHKKAYFMRYLILLSALVLAGCQSPPPAPESPATTNASELTPEKRSAINACLVEIGMDPLPEVLAGINAAMTQTQSEAYQACMARQSN